MPVTIRYFCCHTYSYDDDDDDDDDDDLKVFSFLPLQTV